MHTHARAHAYAHANCWIAGEAAVPPEGSVGGAHPVKHFPGGTSGGCLYSPLTDFHFSPVFWLVLVLLKNDWLKQRNHYRQG